jgi:hypothetical protein
MDAMELVGPLADTAILAEAFPISLLPLRGAVIVTVGEFVVGAGDDWGDMPATP